MRLLGLDYGAARIGVALGDTESRIANPWQVIANTDEETVFATLSELLKREQAQGFVVGVPRLLSDTSIQTAQASEIRGFIMRMKERGWVVYEQDETWSTKTAANQQKERGQKGKRDDLAASVILQSYLDRF
ncbi:MAG: Holliday junction resolvase RuvX [Candidatus Magasanikbacteria bacterium]|nr:Holliday junction resolvase RuvX [Candidatus Magasanikbacteria bacterium]MCA9389334.1 Holliday junction resolvase RuvX [Candidatus Magasanikbacteria bacterium]MCA9390919.1 Holliday junction resolvase RuvX [Candidatus Magasanikbacteria bacterium]USN52892.1 MAG: Holliday junction resolvase RuvX [Candidatus Nomurabacteria bacterium]HPF95295.1 Holliday junction resolvase RuvX [bacterium]